MRRREESEGAAVALKPKVGQWKFQTKLISIQTDTAGCRGGGGLRGGMNIYQKMPSYGSHIDTPNGKREREKELKRERQKTESKQRDRGPEAHRPREERGRDKCWGQRGRASERESE